ncbi:MAG: hypothetical protein PHT58_08445, partial [Eubacteriales bacterium]|nr:hypothetical protein [Eubacteriales bacterium]
IVTDAAVAATCTETGLTEGSHCTRCEDATVAQTVVAALGHDFGEWTVITAATCTQEGYERRYCSRCEEYETRGIAPLGHTEEIRNALEATYFAEGYTGDTYCSVCDELLAAGTIIPMINPTQMVNTLGAQARMETWDAIRFGASFNVDEIKAALNVGDTFTYGFYAYAKLGVADGQLLGQDVMNKKFYGSANGAIISIEWTAELEAMTAPELAEALKEAGFMVYDYNATTITFALVINNMAANSDKDVVFRGFVQANNNELFGLQKYNSIDNIRIEGASTLYPDAQ